MQPYIDIIFKYYYSLDYQDVILNYNKEIKAISALLEYGRKLNYIINFINGGTGIEPCILKNYVPFSNNILLLYINKSCLIYDGHYVISIITDFSFETCLIALKSNFNVNQLYTKLIHHIRPSDNLCFNRYIASERLNRYLNSIYNSNDLIYQDKALVNIDPEEYSHCSKSYFDLDKLVKI